MKTITISAQVYDDFEEGDCYDCPFSYLAESEIYYPICVLASALEDCPIEVKGEAE